MMRLPLDETVFSKSGRPLRKRKPLYEKASWRDARNHDSAGRLCRSGADCLYNPGRSTFRLSPGLVNRSGAAAIIICMEMCGRVAAVAREPVFAVVRRCLGFRLSLATLIASNLLNLVTCAAELGGIAIVLHLLTGWNERLLLVVGGVVGRHYIFISFSVDRTYFRPYGTAHDRIRRFRLSSFDRTGPVSPRGCFPWPPFRMETMPLSTGILRLESSAPC